MGVDILGLGTAVPAHSMSQAESWEHAKLYSCANENHSKILKELYRRTTISRRSSVLVQEGQKADIEFYIPPNNTNPKGPTTAQRMYTYKLHAANLSVLACRSAIKEAGIQIEQITHLITVSCTGFSAPGFDLQLIDLLSLNRNVYRTHIGFMGCHGAMNALRVAEGHCAGYKQAIVLLCATEICSLHFQYGWDANGLLANSLFADGSAAMILGNVSGKLRYEASTSFVVPETDEAITWHISDNGFVMTLLPQVSELIQSNLPELLDGWLKKNSLTVKDIAAWAVHPGGPRILNAVQTSLEISSDCLDASRQILAEYGNMSSPTVFFILQRLLKSQVTMPCVMLGFGPGMTIEAALLR
jgi:predicted naringenin-chalcone synthase